MKYTEVNKIYKTDNYGMFKRLEGNRAVSELRKKRLNDSFDKVGQIPAPIVVNDKMEIIDGQGRFEVSRERNLPIYFTVIKGIGDRECICMNTGTMNWSMRDYVDFYAEKGLKDYITLKELDDKYTNIPLSAIIPMARGVSANTQGYHNENVKEGTYKITIELDELESCFKFIDSLLPTLRKKTRANSIIPVLTACYKSKAIDAEILKNKVLNHSDLIVFSKDKDSFCDSLTTAYNYSRRGKYVDFKTEFINSQKESA